MKKILFTLGLALGVQVIFAQYCGNSGVGQCNPNVQNNQPGLWPPPAQLAPLINGEVSTTVLQFYNYDTLDFQGHVLTMDSLTILQITNLPEGLCWSTNEPTNTFQNQERGCIKLSGTTCAPPGQYQLDMLISMETDL
jgi:hypothetical protein